MNAPDSQIRDGGRRHHVALEPWPHYDPDEIAAVEAVLRSGRANYWTGTEAREFEREYARSTGTRYAIAVANGTVALELALVAAGIGPGDEVVTTPRTFIASASCIVMRGARPVFADVDPNSQNLTAASIEPVVTSRTRAIIVVHLGGWPCEMDDILRLARQHELTVIEDCAQANGARYRGREVGSLGSAGAFSFCQDKIISTGGEGGLLTTDDEALWNAAWSFKDHGKSYEAVYHRQHAPGFRWLHDSFGTNWRMTEMQAAIGRIQLRKLPAWSALRERNASLLRAGLSKHTALRVPEPPAHVVHGNYRFYAFVRPDALRQGWSRDRIIAEFGEGGVPGMSGTCSEIYRERAFRVIDEHPRTLPVARELGETSIALPVHPTLTEGSIGKMIDVVADVMNRAVR